MITEFLTKCAVMSGQFVLASHRRAAFRLTKRL
ncbi:unnamed protein product [Rodentolepis nana]|uniref:Transcriptional regulator n=1 Tax=Rodentolepis nana TaxID=102285 RepID=A0A0R3TSI9_RODNA|nr:unnamed protein product [Rodentolepis nana]